jgi:hypothetical protein
MPHCEECGQEVDENDLRQGVPGETVGAPTVGPEFPAGPGQEQRCPNCGAELGQETGEEGEEGEEIHPNAPWHFKVLIVGSVVYLGYRLYQGIGWLIHHA